VCKILNELLHIQNWKSLNIFIPKTSGRSVEAIAAYGRLYNAFKIRTRYKKECKEKLIFCVVFISIEQKDSSRYTK
jgi:hypothetical protein